MKLIEIKQIVTEGDDNPFAEERIKPSDEFMKMLERRENALERQIDRIPYELEFLANSADGAVRKRALPGGAGTANQLVRDRKYLNMSTANKDTMLVAPNTPKNMGILVRMHSLDQRRSDAIVLRRKVKEKMGRVRRALVKNTIAGSWRR